MKKMVYLGCLFMFLPAMVFAQEKIEAPVWNVGDKWVFDREGPIEVIGCDAQWYSVRFSGGIFPKDASGIAIFERSTLNVKYLLEKDKRKDYRGFRKKILNFPLTPGKQWKGLFERNELGPIGGIGRAEYQETFRSLGWEEVEVRAGKFRAIKLEYKFVRSFGIGSGGENKAWYWYSPEIKNLVKCQHEKGYSEGYDERGGWELVLALQIVREWPINKCKPEPLNYRHDRQKANSERQGHQRPAFSDVQNCMKLLYIHHFCRIKNRCAIFSIY
jgi:hypothetical protein